MAAVRRIQQGQKELAHTEESEIDARSTESVAEAVWAPSRSGNVCEGSRCWSDCLALTGVWVALWMVVGDVLRDGGEVCKFRREDVLLLFIKSKMEADRSLVCAFMATASARSFPQSAPSCPRDVSRRDTTRSSSLRMSACGSLFSEISCRMVGLLASQVHFCISVYAWKHSGQGSLTMCSESAVCLLVRALCCFSKECLNHLRRVLRMSTSCFVGLVIEVHSGAGDTKLRMS